MKAKLAVALILSYHATLRPFSILVGASLLSSVSPADSNLVGLHRQVLWLNSTQKEKRSRKMKTIGILCGTTTDLTDISKWMFLNKCRLCYGPTLWCNICVRDLLYFQAKLVTHGFLNLTVAILLILTSVQWNLESKCLMGLSSDIWISSTAETDNIGTLLET